ncbi:hypothetical protein [Neobacillus cucumis]|uniref:hypothetical protein n=1 Tax=Neobacillus cucumis TaxID=1740721 RepID=UPI001963B982|nr:hypothetical protein [Neobacillus cucumis]MBM7656184.1 hypothetical protein [Neobacillus cucumis]
MFGFFSLRSKKSEKEIREGNKLNTDILTKLDRIIELLEQQQTETSMRNIHFDSVQIDHLENIIFRLDKIEVDELSGKLIIGNNINTTSDIADVLKKELNPDKESSSEKSTIGSNKITNTTKGFRFHL